MTTRLTLLLCLLLSAGCLSIEARGDGAAEVKAEAAQTLFLIGDAGRPATGGDPVLIALRRDLLVHPERNTVVVLGDNIYPAGLPREGHPDRAAALRYLDDQVDIVRDTGARVVFIPGNHDWDNGGVDGLDAVKRQEARVLERGGANVSYLPGSGCPGPSVVDAGDRLRIVVLDTQWWLHAHARPQDPSSNCAADSEAEILAGLREAVQVDAPRVAVVVSHHPPVSGGPHGGHFGLRHHLFPLTERYSWLWLPLPGLGSVYPIARKAGVTVQDITNATYQRMRDAIGAVLRERPPLAWAAGHEHTLQVIEDPRFGRVLVSGSGYFGHVSPVKDVTGTRYRSSRSGYMRIDLLKDGRRRLAVIEVERDSRTREGYAAFIESKGAVLPPR